MKVCPLRITRPAPERDKNRHHSLLRHTHPPSGVPNDREQISPSENDHQHAAYTQTKQNRLGTVAPTNPDDSATLILCQSVADFCI